MKTIIVLLALFALSALSQKCPATAKDILGPYYQPGAPVRDNIVCTNTPASDRLYVTGQLTDTNCRPIPRATLDIWHADERGEYSPGASGKNFECRSKITTDENGNYKFLTIFPGRYDDNGYRPAHIHFTITGEKSPVKFDTFTTQLYFNKDYYLHPRDSCKRCGSGHASLVAEVVHLDDIKTYVGKWDIHLNTTSSANDFEFEDASGNYREAKDSIMPKDDLITRLMKQIIELRKRQ
ncbi:catechol 1,-dioxygenase [Acrasis kona]|uniref:Catechol 1,-dioxygenase n=1 Tax=Acrasis kona TaxID=1008807 RepID=A0AAW2Z2K6_9EUKA